MKSHIVDDDEVLDLIAEAARTSKHAVRAYEILRDKEPLHILPLVARQRHIEGRMKDVA